MVIEQPSGDNSVNYGLSDDCVWFDETRVRVAIRSSSRHLRAVDSRRRRAILVMWRSSVCTTSVSSQMRTNVLFVPLPKTL